MRVAGRMGLAVALLWVLRATPAAAALPELEEILRVWQERQAASETIQIEWTAVRTEKKGSNNYLDRLLPSRPLTEIPSDDLDVRNECALLVSGNRSRYSCVGQIWNLDKGALVPYHDTVAFNGAQLADFQPEVGDEKYPQAITQDATANPKLELLEMRPLVWFFWPLRKDRGGIDAAGLAVQKAVIGSDGLQCILLDNRGSAAIDQTGWWEFEVEPFHVWRIQRAVKRDSSGKPKWRYDIDYPVDDAIDAIVGWTATNYQTGEIARTWRCSVTAFARNPKVSDADFELKLPPGTVLFENNGAAGTLSLVDEQGIAHPAKFQPRSYAELIANDKVKIDQPRRQNNWWWLLGLNLLIAGITAYLIRRHGQSS